MLLLKCLASILAMSTLSPRRVHTRTLRYVMLEHLLHTWKVCPAICSAAGAAAEIWHSEGVNLDVVPHSLQCVPYLQ